MAMLAERPDRQHRGIASRCWKLSVHLAMAGYHRWLNHCWSVPQLRIRCPDGIDPGSEPAKCWGKLGTLPIFNTGIKWEVSLFIPFSCCEEVCAVDSSLLMGDSTGSSWVDYLYGKLVAIRRIGSGRPRHLLWKIRWNYFINKFVF